MTKLLFGSIFSFIFAFSASPAYASAKIMNPGEAVGQLVILADGDVSEESEKYKSLNPLSIPVFTELPLDLSVIAGAITLKQQNELSHVQVKARARRTPNLDISELDGGLSNPLLSKYRDGDWIRLNLSKDGIVIEPASQELAEEFYRNRKTENVNLKSDLSAKKIFATSELSSADFVRVGAKAANYGELAKALNTPERMVVRPGFAIPFAYYEEFVESNPKVKRAIQDVLEDPIMDELMDVQYREKVLSDLRAEFQAPSNVINQELIDSLIEIYDQQKDSKGKLRKMKMRSSTNSEDLPNFNGAGLYTSDSYKPYKKDTEKSRNKKEESLREVLQIVWSSVWELRAFDERNYFSIPHSQVKMGMQINPSFGDEDADGVVVTRHTSTDPKFPGTGVYIEAQRGDVHAVANPVEGAKPQKILVLFNKENPLEKNEYKISILQSSNIADDNKKILKDKDNPNPVLTDAEIADLTYQVLKAEAHFKPILGKDNPDFSLDLEFKVDSEDSGERKVYLKQARPYIQ